METPEPQTTLSVAQLRIIRVPRRELPAVAVWLMELRNVKWAAPSDWMQQMLDAIGPAAEMDDDSVKTSAPLPTTFEIVVQTKASVVDWITLRHALSALFESWCRAVDPYSDSQQEQLTRDVAESRIREILTDSLGALEEVKVEKAELEDGSEWFFRFAVGTNHYVGTASQEHRLLLFHAAHPPER